MSRIDPVTGSEAVLYRGPADAAGWTNPMAAAVRNAAVVGGGVYYTTTRGGRPGWSGQTPTDDRSTIVRVDLATGQATTLATFGRESRGLTAAADGSLVNAWYDGEYTSNSLYVPESATVGVSRVDPGTGVETVLSSQPSPAVWGRPSSDVNAVTAAAGAVVVAESTPGYAGWPPYQAPQDDASTLRRVGGPSYFLGSFPRESRGLATVPAAATPPVTPPTVPPLTPVTPPVTPPVVTPPVVPPVVTSAPPKPPAPAPSATVTRVYPVSATEGTKVIATLAAVKLPPGPSYRVTVF